jgi:ABC-type amino acid transport substrate-binding protein
MNDDRVRRILRAAEQPLAPSSEYAAALLDDLKTELGFDLPRRPAPARPVATQRAGAARTSRRFDLLLVAALVIGAVAALIPVAGALRDRVPPQPRNALAEIREAGRIRIAIRPDHPQFTVGSPAGFDVDVAAAIATELGVSPELVVVEAEAMPDGNAGTWDIALPSVPAWQIDRGAFELSRPYYHWRHRLVVPDGSPAATVDDLAGAPVCAVAGDAGEAWLAGRYGGVTASPITALVVTMPSDAECLAALESGDVAAAVTARLSDAEIGVRAGVRAIGGPDPEPRVAIVPRPEGAPADPSDLLSEIDGAIAALRADGTLTRLSQNRFGGDDVSVP